jgi:hypothetical protein
MANLKLKENLDIKSTGVSTSGKNSLPKTGDIIPFAGTVAPTGWAICDGTSGTPDLRGFFTVGALSSGNIGVTYGNTSHSHTTSVAAYGINNAPAFAAHGYNAITSSIGGYDYPSHTHNGQTATRSSGSTSSNLLANSTNAGGPIAFVPRPHAHTQSSAVNSNASNASNHVHNGATVNMSLDSYHGYNSSTGQFDQAHNVTSNLSGNLSAPAKDYLPFIIMNYIMKI